MKGFTQIPILIAIIISAMVFGSGGYFIAHRTFKTQQFIPQINTTSDVTVVKSVGSDKPRPNIPKITLPSPSKLDLSAFNDKNKSETRNIKSGSSIRYIKSTSYEYIMTDENAFTATGKTLSKGTKVRFISEGDPFSKIEVDGQVVWVFSSDLINTEPAIPELPDIIKKWRPIVAYVECDFRDTNTNQLYSQVSGSGTVIDSGGQITVITNRHVITDKNNFQPFSCRVKLPDHNYTYTSQNFIGGGALDIGMFDINNPDEYIKNLTSISTSPLDFCRQKPPVGESVIILGYPSVGSQDDITVTEGMVSGYDGNYFITSAKIEHGNSGGVAILLKGDCYLGIPSGVVAGELESFGRILNINAAFLK